MKRVLIVIATSTVLSGCGPSDDEIYATCVEIANTRKMDGAERIRILKDIGIKPHSLELAESLITLGYTVGDNGHVRCVQTIQARLKD